MANYYSEDHHVQKTTAEYMQDSLKWDTLFAFDEKLGTDGTLERKHQKKSF